MLSKLANNPGLKWAVMGAIAFFSFTLLLTLHRHFTFYSSYDQGIFNQVFWNSLHGRFFQSSLSSQLSTNVIHSGEVAAVDYHRLGQHFTPALLLWLPIYAVFPYPATLIVLQVTLVTAGGLVLYALAKCYLKPPVAGIITVSFYSAIAILGPTMGNFHDICQMPLLVFGILLAMEKRRWWLFWLLGILLLMVREDSGITFFGIGFYLVLSKRYPRVGLAVCSLSFLYMIALTNLIMPLFSEDISKRFMLERFGQYAQGEEASTIEIIWGMVSNPWRLLRELFTPFFGTLKYLLGQWLPLAFIPAVAPAAWIIAGFPLLKLFLGKGDSVLVITIRYAMSVVPGIFYGTILWWAGQGFNNFTQKIETLKPRKLTPSFRRFWVFCIIVSLILTLVDTTNRTLYFIIPDSFQPWVYVSLPEQWQQTKEINSLLAKIPPDASVSATTYLIPHLSGRREIIRLPALELRNDEGKIIKVEYAIADLWQLKEYQVAFSDEGERLKEITALINQVINDNEYGILSLKNGIILLRKGAANHPRSLEDWLAFEKQIIQLK
ncbi:MAG: DUF2079 domain-containing protein [Gomphosphaeria aponina SAG 52.96 = DSM 107014]|uniref:DUF2079 domain-containing protein n=1 Tax=Gomphosphaeria aponina SAG 52.96 = DSM 107014 TaxID=1521640 RepID=A0A941GQU1_9CHRO|nr:DUF2079 domain-containing protein [Gomphosphaeria aponina SAG 52.96 = DSM 107014]